MYLLHRGERVFGGDSAYYDANLVARGLRDLYVAGGYGDVSGHDFITGCRLFGCAVGGELRCLRQHVPSRRLLQLAELA